MPPTLVVDESLGHANDGPSMLPAIEEMLSDPVVRAVTSISLYARGGSEPAIDEMLSDPVVLAMMSRDGIAAGEVRSIVASLRQRLAVPDEPSRSEFKSRAAAEL